MFMHGRVWIFSRITQWQGMVMEPNKVLFCMFLFSFLALTVHNSCLLTEELTSRNVWLHNSCRMNEWKTKDCA